MTYIFSRWRTNTRTFHILFLCPGKKIFPPFFLEWAIVVKLFVQFSGDELEFFFLRLKIPRLKFTPLHRKHSSTHIRRVSPLIPSFVVFSLDTRENIKKFIQTCIRHSNTNSPKYPLHRVYIFTSGY